MDLRSKEKVIELEVYTDGSCKKINYSTTFGGWAFIVIRDGQKIYEAAGSENPSSNQRMELKAILEGLKYAASIRRPNEKVVIYSDSAYAINCYHQDWYIRWLENGWLNINKQPVANMDLWVEIVPYFDNFWYDFRKVKGHSNVFWNEECDKKAQEQAEEKKYQWRIQHGQ